MDAQRLGTTRGRVGRYVVVSAIATDRGACGAGASIAAELLDVGGTYATEGDAIAAVRAHARRVSVLPMVAILIASDAWRGAGSVRPEVRIWTGPSAGRLR